MAVAGIMPFVSGCDPVSHGSIVQGMNFVVALLLLAADKDPLRAFWLMVVLLDQVLVPDNYAPNLDGCHVEMRVLGSLIKDKRPKVAAHLEVRTQCNTWFWHLGRPGGNIHGS